MKELSIEEKAKRYDEAIEMAKNEYQTHKSFNGFCEMLSHIFPELIEREDERIRKALIKYYSFNKDGGSHALDNITPKQILAWLEKQGEKEPITCPICGYIEEPDFFSDFRNSDVEVDSNEEKQGEQKPNPCDGCINRKGCINCENGELRETEHKPVFEMKTPEESLCIDSDTYNKIVDDCIYGEQKPIDKIQIGKKYKCIASPRYTTFMIGQVYKPNDKFLCSLMNFCSDCFEPFDITKPQGKTALEAIKEEKVDNANKVEPKDYSNIDPHFFKTTNKVKPKFHENEWVVTDKNNVVHIKAIENGKYVLENTMSFTVDYVDKCWRKWTIEDAKPGDVLVEQNGEMPFIFKECKNNHIYCYCGYTNRKDMFFDMFIDSEGEELHWLNLYHEQAYPATKAQRDLLFQKMKERGYEWDADQKKLEKIKKAPQKFMVGDTIRYNGTEYKITEITPNGYKVYALTYDEDSASLISFSAPAILVEQKPAWNEEDYTWKPSESQLEALDDFIYAKYPNIEKYEAAVKSLYQDLKKLKG